MEKSWFTKITNSLYYLFVLSMIYQKKKKETKTANLVCVINNSQENLL